MKKFLPLLLIIIILAFASCTADIEDPMLLHGDSWEAIFREFWTVMDEEYVHFRYETVDWDNVYGEYMPKFRSLSYDSEEDTFKAFRYFKEIVSSLSDYHYRLIIEAGYGYTLDTRPSVMQKWRSAGYDIMDLPDIRTGKSAADYKYYSVNNGPGYATPKNHDEMNEVWARVVSGYTEITDLGDAFHTPSSSSSFKFLESGAADFSHRSELYFDSLASKTGLADTKWFYGVTDNGVLYLYFSKFVTSGALQCFTYLYDYDNLSEEEKAYGDSTFRLQKIAKAHIMDDDDESAKKILNAMGHFAVYFRNAVNNGYVTLENGKEVTIKGIVVDLRCNGGGDADFMTEFAGTFFASSKTVGYTYAKDGYSRYEYTPWVEYTLGDNWNHNLKKDYAGRVAVITNGFSASCSELTTIISKLLPSSRRFGSATFGGTCALTSRIIQHSGEYENGNLKIRTTSYRYKAYDGTSYEGIGISPDEPIALSADSDLRFDRAVRWAGGED